MQVPARFRFRRVVAAAASLALTASLVQVGSANALAPCGYWTTNRTVEKTVQAVGSDSSGGSWFTSKVTYQLFVDCPVAYTKIKVVSFTNTMKFLNMGNYWHEDYDRGVVKWFSQFASGGYQQPMAYYDDTHYWHQGDGTWSTTRNLNLVMGYDTRAAVMAYWVGVGQFGRCYAKFAYKFIGNTLPWFVSC